MGITSKAFLRLHGTDTQPVQKAKPNLKLPSQFGGLIRDRSAGAPERATAGRRSVGELGTVTKAQLAKTGNSEGAKKGWETRKRGGGPAEPAEQTRQFADGDSVVIDFKTMPGGNQMPAGMESLYRGKIIGFYTKDNLPQRISGGDFNAPERFLGKYRVRFEDGTTAAFSPEYIKLAGGSKSTEPAEQVVARGTIQSVPQSQAGAVRAAERQMMQDDWKNNRVD